MASSNRHWPSLFKSKPCNTHHQWQHDINSSSLLSTACQKPPYTSAHGCEERTPEPKPRWNPKPEQIRILEAIFNSGMVNPPRDEIRNIRAQLQEYGQVGDANVFYWFQNRKSRSKHKQRQLQSRHQSRAAAAAPSSTAAAAASSSSSSSDPSNSSGSTDKTLSSKTAAGATNVVDLSNSPTASVNQAFLNHSQGDQFFFQSPHGYCLPIAPELSSLAGVADPGPAAAPPGFRPGLWNELIMSQQEGCKCGGAEELKAKMQLHHIYGTTAAAAAATTTTCITTCATTATSTIASPVSDIKGVGYGNVGAGASRSVVFINEVAFEVGSGPLNVREAFGEAAVLLHSSGLPVIVDEWGVTLQTLQNGASFYLI